MSEYQCYEFVALERPLAPEQMAELRAISTRAEITSTRFWNEYQWGDLKADAAKLVQRYFDAHMYFASWGTHRLMLRIPVKNVDVKALRGYFAGNTANAKVVGGHLVLDLRSEDEEADYYEESQGSLAALAPVRTELMRGDLRAAYLAWLLAVQTGEVRDKDTEPPVPPGLSHLTAAQAAMVEFLRIDVDLLDAATTASAPEIDDVKALRAWALTLTPRAKDEWLARAIDDRDLTLGVDLRRAFHKQTRALTPRFRRVAELHAAAEELREKRERAEVLARKKTKKVVEARSP